MKATLLIACGTLAGCATTETRYDYIENFCLLAEPIRPSVDDVLTEGTAQQILVHNNIGAAHCSW